MRRKDKEITDRKTLDEILNHAGVCRIALNNGEFPYIVPFYYGYSDGMIYFHSAKTGKKIDLIRKNNKVCFEIEYDSQIIRHDEACQWTAKYRSVIGYGTIDIITAPAEKKKGLDKIMSHYGGPVGNIYNEKHIDNIVLLRLTIHTLTGKQSGNWDV